MQMCDNGDDDSTKGASWPITPECLRYYDEIRNSQYVIAETKPFSNVVRATTAQNKTYRLCHLTSMLPSTSDSNGTLLPDFGLYTEGAGLLAMIHFNSKNFTVIPDLERIKDCNVRFTMEFKDTQLSPIEACRVLTQDVLSRTHSISTPLPISMVGATRSAVTGPLAILGGIGELPLVSFGATSSQLDQKDKYPYFGRTVPPNQGDAKAAVSYIRDVLRATHFGVVFVRDPYGTAFHSEIISAAQELVPPMDVVSAPYEPFNQESIVSAMRILQRSKYRIFFGIISTPTYNSVMREAYKAGIAGTPGYSWFLSAVNVQLLSFSYDAAKEKDLAEASNGVGIISLDITDNNNFTKAWQMLNRDAVRDYFVSKHDPQLDFSQFAFYDNPTYWEYLQYDALMALGFAACEVQDEYFTGPSLFDSFVQTSFQGASGSVAFDEVSGSRDYSVLRYKMINVVARAPDERNRITFSSSTTSVRNGTQWLEKKPFVYFEGTATPPSDLPPVVENLNLISDGLRIFGLTLAGIFILISLVFASWTLVKRKTAVVRLTQPFFLDMVCFGTFLMSTSIIFMSFQEPMSNQALDVACMAVPWLLSIGFVVAFSALLSKTLRINKLAHHSGGFRRVKVRAQDVLVQFLILFSLNVIILTVWTVVAPLKWVRIKTGSIDKYGRSVESYGTCQSEDRQLQLLFFIILVSADIFALVFANVANYRARRLSPYLHETGPIAVSLATMLEASVIGIPALLAVHDIPSAFYIVRAVLVSIFCGAILFPLFLPKIVQARQESNRTTMRHVREWSSNRRSGSSGHS